MILVFDFFTAHMFFSVRNCTMNYNRFISRNGYRTRRIYREGNRDATSKRDTRFALWTIVNLSSYVLSRAIRTHFAFSLSAVQTKVCELTSSDLNIYTDVHRRVLCHARAYRSYNQISAIATKAEAEQYCPSKARFGCLNVWLLIFRRAFRADTSLSREPAIVDSFLNHSTLHPAIIIARFASKFTKGY